jgi:hypothetical protein
VSHQSCFYKFQWAPAVVRFEDVWGVNLRRWLPSVIALWISLPFDEVLKGSGPSMTSMADDALDFKHFFSINQIRRWAREVWSMGGRFLIGR